MNLDLNADPDPVFHSDAGPDPASKSNADLDRSPDVQPLIKYRLFVLKFLL
jgi:hypothetical protein